MLWRMVLYRNMRLISPHASRTDATKSPYFLKIMHKDSIIGQSLQALR